MDKSVFFSIMRTVFCQHESYCAHVYKPTVTFHIISIFPEVFEKYLNTSMLWRAKKEKKALYKIWNPRNYTKDKHKKVDHRPYGGGPGMVMTAEPILLAVNKALGRKKIGAAAIGIVNGLIHESGISGASVNSARDHQCYYEKGSYNKRHHHPRLFKTFPSS